MEIENESRHTLEDMRELVGVLREDSSDAPTSPQPTLTHLEALLVRAKGADARLVVEGSPRVLPAGVELSAYRVVEHLLAALDDAPDVEVKIRFSDAALELAVSGPARRRSKAAIDRARERVQLHRGTLEATTHDGRAEAVASLRRRQGWSAVGQPETTTSTNPNRHDRVAPLARPDRCPTSRARWSSVPCARASEGMIVEATVR